MRKVNYIQGTASFVDAEDAQHRARRGRRRETLTFEHAIIATGSRPTTVPGLSIDSPRVMDSTGALDLPDIPKTLLVVGGGYIGLELGSVYAALGTKVTVVEMTPGLLPGADRDLVDVPRRGVSRQTLHKILLNTRVVEMKDAKNGVTVRIEGDGLADADKDADVRPRARVGRPQAELGGARPRQDEGQGRRARVHHGRRGACGRPSRTSSRLATSSASRCSRTRRRTKRASPSRRSLGHKVAFEPQAIPAVVFTDPEVAWCGLTETEAQKQGRKVEIAKFPWAALGRAVAIDRPDGLTKLIIDPETERILGVGIVGSGAGELIAEGVLAVEMAALATDLKLSIHPHPTLSETLMEAAEVFFGQSTHVYRPKKRA